MAKTKKRRVFPKFILLYIVLVCAAVIVGMRFFWTYLENYEANQPEVFMEQYEAELDDAQIMAMADGFVDSMDARLTDREAVYRLVLETVEDGLGFAKKSANLLETDITYAILYGDRAIGELEIVKEGEAGAYGFKSWMAKRAEIRLPELIQSSTLTVPAAYTVSVNGNTIDESYITETGIQYDFLKEYYEQFPELPTKVTYSFENYAGPLNLEVFDRNGASVTISPDAGDEQFLEALSEAEDDALNDFAKDFLEKYFQYISGIGSLTTSYNNLSRYLIDGSELVQRLKAAEDGLYWAHTSSIKLESYTINMVVKVDDNTLLMDLTAMETATRDAANATETYEIGMKMVLFGNAEDGYKVATLDLY